MSQKNINKTSPVSNDKLQYGSGDVCYLILHNDDIHTFDYVIESLIEVCGLDPFQAEQCTFIVHYKGKCDIKKGTYTELLPFKNGLIERGLTVTIE